MVSGHKKKTMVLLVVCACALICFVFIDVKYDKNIRFSKPSGFYNEAFQLEILGGGRNQVYYTLDGSEPTIESYLYEKEKTILIDDVTLNENIYSARTDTSTAFFTELVEQYSMDNPNYTVPNYKVDKCNVIRAAVFDKDGKCLDTAEGVYFVGFEEKTGYENIYVASIVTDPENLFGYEQGIYNTGRIFDEYVSAGFNPEDWKTEYWWWWNTNYKREGREGEREASVVIFDENRDVVLSQNCGIRIQGGGSRGYLPKSLGCFARVEYSGSNEFQADIFEKDVFPHKFVFFSGGDDNVFKLKDYLANYMEQELSFATMKFIPCAVFLDGEYWGIYYITENYNSDYVSDHYDVNEDQVIIVKNKEITEGDEGDLNTFFNMQEYISTNDMTISENYNQACTLIDIENYIDYYAAQIYIGRNNDWPGGNWAAWRTRDDDGSKNGDTKWRWMLFDVNSGGLDIYQMESDALAGALERDPVFYSLYQNEEFRVKLAKRILYIGKEIYTPEKCETFLENYEATMKEPIMVSNLRFYNSTREDEFNLNLANMKAFFEVRYEVVWKLLVNNMGETWLEENGIQK